MRGAAAAVLTCAILAGCGEGGDGAPSGSPISLDEPVQLADCTDWNEGSVDERLGTLKQIENFAGGSVPGTGGRGVLLDQDRAYDLFEEACSNSIAQGFTLYKIYVRAAAFSGQGQ